MQDRYLFRGKSAYDKEWVTGELVHDMFGNCLIITKMLGDVSNCTDCGMPYFEYCEVDPATVGQYTGLKDKNGKLIFEGDLVTVTRYSYDEPDFDESGEMYITPLGCALWDEETCRHKNLIDMQGTFTTTYEVYGNIHDKEGENEV